MMKKLIAVTLVLMCALTASAQGIYTSVHKYDKFDDVVWEKEIKTLITKTDSTIIIETKGTKPVEYYILGGEPFYVFGRRDSIVNLVSDVYGYEETFLVYTKDDFENKRKQILEVISDSIGGYDDRYIDLKTRLGLLEEADKLPIITIRAVSKTQYYFTYDTEFFWIKFNDGSRLIYYKK